MIQHTHQTTEFQEKKFPIILLLDHVVSPANIGSLFRLSDAFNIEKIIFAGSQVDLDSNRLKRTARSTIESVEHEQVEDAISACESLSKNGYTLIALEIAKDSLAVQEINFEQFEKVVLILGNENNGIKEKLLKKADKKVHINMFGQNSSMNVAQAAGIALFEITKSLHPCHEK